MPIRLLLLLLWDNHITGRLPYGMAIQETKLVPNLFPHISAFFQSEEPSPAPPSSPISLTLPQLPTSLVRLQHRWWLDRVFRAVQN